jgi:hypothetical protein
MSSYYKHGHIGDETKRIHHVEDYEKRWGPGEEGIKNHTAAIRAQRLKEEAERKAEEEKS